MGRVLVHGAKVAEGRIVSLDVQLGGLPRRAIDRDTAIRWMRDMHSFVPMRGGRPAPALVLAEIEGDDGPAWFIRADTAQEPADQLPPLG
ncbi:MAG TPA: hypothetical protein PKA64_08260 [Myxococcota bacterium]|nr:hypothetical protein [Myxococcota bacterium]